MCVNGGVDDGSSVAERLSEVEGVEVGVSECVSGGEPVPVRLGDKLGVVVGVEVGVNS